MNAGVLAEVGRALVNLHGQHDAQTLLDPEAQRRILDAFAGADRLPGSVAHAHDELAAIIREIADLSKRRAEAERRADYLRHVVREIGDAKLVDGEDVRLEDEARRLENADELRALAGGLAAALDGDEDAVLQRARRDRRSSLSAIQRIDPTLSRLQEIVRLRRTTPSKRWRASSRSTRRRSTSIRRASKTCVAGATCCSA